MMSAKGRADALHAAIKAANPNYGRLNSAEDQALYSNLQALWGNADLGYICSSAQINPGSLESAANQPVVTAGNQFSQSGYVTAATPIIGLGTIS